MKLRYEFTVMDMGDGFAAVPVGDDASAFHGMLKMNDIAADILGQLKEDTEPMAIHNYLKSKYPDSTDHEIGTALADFLNELYREGLLIV